jgi:hypothetical protein
MTRVYPAAGKVLSSLCVFAFGPVHTFLAMLPLPFNHAPARGWKPNAGCTMPSANLCHPTPRSIGIPRPTKQGTIALDGGGSVMAKTKDMKTKAFLPYCPHENSEFRLSVRYFCLCLAPLIQCLFVHVASLDLVRGIQSLLLVPSSRHIRSEALEMRIFRHLQLFSQEKPT